MFTRQHYQVVADVMQATADDTFHEESVDVAFGAAYRMAYQFKHDNGQFDIDRFMVASGFGRNWRETFDLHIKRLDIEEGFKWPTSQRSTSGG
jgi:hypothetical protein